MPPRVFKPLSPYGKKFDIEKPGIEKQEFFAGLTRYGKLIIDKSGEVFGTVDVFYTVPAKKVLFLCFAELTWITTTAAAAASQALLNVAPAGTGSYVGMIVARTPEATVQHETIPISFPIPLKFVAGSLFEVQSAGATCGAIATITGYEVDEVFLPLFT